MTICLKALYEVLLGQGRVRPALLDSQEQGSFQQALHVGFVDGAPCTIKLNGMSVSQSLVQLCRTCLQTPVLSVGLSSHRSLHQ